MSDKQTDEVRLAEIEARDALWYEIVCDADGVEVPARIRNMPDKANIHWLLTQLKARDERIRELEALAGRNTVTIARLNTMLAHVGKKP